ncbi:MAG: ABC-2 type transport system ATP-binding protein [Verrucomicrobiales bacterium]|jgi:ABC-2 type transport system ATP-binding protein
MKSDETPVIETIGLSRDYGGRTGVDQINLKIESGRVVALLGPNGAGKTTLLKLIAGVLEPGAGTCRVNSPTVVSSIDGHEPPGVATAEQIFSLQAAATPSFDRKFAQQLLEDRAPLNIEFGSLSKGQKRLVLSATNLASRAKLILLDEPADGVDPAGRRELFGQIRSIANDTGAAILVATHILEDVERVADDIAIIQAGKLRLFAPLEDLREQVRELEVPSDFKPPAEVDVLHRSDGFLTIRCPNDWDATSSSLPQSVVNRAVSLSDLYIAVTSKN